MHRLVTISACLALLISIIAIYAPDYITAAKASITASVPFLARISELITINTTTSIKQTENSNSMSKGLHKAVIRLHKSHRRGHADHGWLNTYHSFSFADWHDPDFMHFGALRVLNEDRVQPQTGFPTHPHRDFEIFSYVLSGELTHRDSMLKKGSEGGQSDKFYRMQRGDVQFTTGGTGIAHSEFNEHRVDPVHFLQIWATPWKRGLTPRYHTKTFYETDKKRAFVPILSPLKAGPDATTKEETTAEPALENTIPIHADLIMAAGIIGPDKTFGWVAGGNVGLHNQRKIYLHMPMTKGGNASVMINGNDEKIVHEGDGAFIENIHKGDKITVTCTGSVDAEVVLLDTA